MLFRDVTKFGVYFDLISLIGIVENLVSGSPNSNGATFSAGTSVCSEP